MIILTDSTDPQSFVFIARSTIFDTIQITDDQTNVPISITEFTVTEGDYYTMLETTFNLIENHYYNLVLKDGNTIVYKDRIFCTNQPIVTFSVNNGQYVSSTTSNTFIVYE